MAPAATDRIGNTADGAVPPLPQGRLEMDRRRISPATRILLDALGAVGLAPSSISSQERRQRCAVKEETHYCVLAAFARLAFQGEGLADVGCLSSRGSTDALRRLPHSCVHVNVPSSVHLSRAGQALLSLGRRLDVAFCPLPTLRPIACPSHPDFGPQAAPMEGCDCPSFSALFCGFPCRDARHRKQTSLAN